MGMTYSGPTPQDGAARPSLCLYSMSPASRCDAQTLHEAHTLAQCCLTGRHISTYVDLLGISSRPVY